MANIIQRRGLGLITTENQAIDFLAYLRENNETAYQRAISKIRGKTLSGLGDAAAAPTWISSLNDMIKNVPSLASTYQNYQLTQAQIDAANLSNKLTASAAAQSAAGQQFSFANSQAMIETVGKIAVPIGLGFLALSYFKSKKK